MTEAFRDTLRRIMKRLAALWPQGPLAGVLMLVGLFNILDGASVPLGDLEHLTAVTGLTVPLSALGGTAQVILGLMLVLAGVGLWWRLVSAWSLSIMLLLVTISVTLVQGKWGVPLILQSLLLGALWWARRHFTRRTILASVLFSVIGILAILAYGTLGSYLLGDGFHPPIRDWATAFYYTIVSLSTVGYGDIVPVTAEARWFAITLLVFGLGVFASAIASVLGPKLSGELQRMFHPKDKPMEYKDHVILVGEGAIADNTAKELEHRGVPFVQIVASEADLMSNAEHPMVEGDATDDAVLRKVGVERARMVIAARDDDGENAFIALVVKDLNPKVRLMAVASSALAIRRLKLAGADLVFSPAAVGSRLMADLVQGNQISAAFQDLLEGGLPRS